MTLATSAASSGKRIHVSIDPRIELLSVVLKLSGYGNLYPGRISDTPSAYLSNVEQYFSRFSDHETVRYFQSINARISGDLPVTIVLYVSEPPQLGLRTPFDAMIRARVEDESSLKQYVEALRSFAEDTEFANFFCTHQADYAAMVASPEKSIRDGDSIHLLEAYYGSQQRAYYVIFAPLLKTVAFGPRVRWENGTLDPYCVFPSLGVADDRITFKEGKALQNRILHEFGHSFVNPLADQYRDELSRYATLMQNIVYKTGANYGMEWMVCVYEHLVRAVTTRLTHHQFGADAGQQEMLAHERQGFIYIKDLCDKLLQYEGHRDTYPTFNDFFPELMGVFKEWFEKASQDPRMSA